MVKFELAKEPEPKPEDLPLKVSTELDSTGDAMLKLNGYTILWLCAEDNGRVHRMTLPQALTDLGLTTDSDCKISTY